MFAIVDLWRSIAVFLVVLAHTLTWWGNPVFFKFIKPSLLGLTGVAIFFVLTSYVLMFSLDRLKKTSNKLYIDFITRRFFRIYPLAIIAVILYYHFNIPSYFENGTDFLPAYVSVSGLIQNILLIQNFTVEKDILGPLWSLPYEFQMYLLLPIIFTYIGNTDSKWRGIFLFFILCLSFFVATDKMDTINKLFSYFEIPAYTKWGLCFIPGVMAYYAQKEFSGKKLNFAYIWPILGLILFSRILNYNFFIQILSAILVGFTLVIIKDDFNPYLKKMCSTISKYSYGIYLSHMLAIYLGFELFGKSLIGWMVFLMSLFILPVLCFHLIEKPFMDYGKRLCLKKYTRAGV
ncbi:acyltransferase family protein [Methylobacter sp. sgz302048]|uniref:acyltransferase family protein n=1 Tax=Methylobacter sp. sgz302048 TaxID=3455945 RepID=UPI003F9EE311